MHRVETDPAHEPIREHLRSFALAFPQGFIPLPQRLHAVLTGSSDGLIQEAKITKHMKTLQAQLDALPQTQGRLRWHTSCHPNLFKQNSSEAAWEAVMKLFSPPPWRPFEVTGRNG